MQIVSTPLPPFPTIDFAEEATPWEWPLPDFIREHLVPPRSDLPQPCTIDMPQGAPVDGEMLRFDAEGHALRFRLHAQGTPVDLAFSRLRRLTLTAPLTALPRPAGGPAWRMPSAEEERSYCVHSHGAGEPLTGITLAHIETPLGLFLYPPAHEDRAVQRVFIPRHACAHAEYGPTAVDEAAERWIATPQDLLLALERQRTMPVLPLGESLLALGLVTRNQLSRALAEADDDHPLGERLVAQGLLARADLETALAHKMGYPIVDLTRFPIDPQAVRRVPQQKVIQVRALPILLHEQRLVMAMDRLSRIHGLRELQTYLQTPIVPVLAPRRQLRLAYAMARQDVWASYVTGASEAFATTR
jgi:hypothetical protein